MNNALYKHEHLECIFDSILLTMNIKCIFDSNVIEHRKLVCLPLHFIVIQVYKKTLYCEKLILKKFQF